MLICRRCRCRSIHDSTLYNATVMRSLITFDWAFDPRLRFMRPMPFNITLPNSLIDATDFEVIIADNSTVAEMEVEMGDDPFWPRPDSTTAETDESSDYVLLLKDDVNYTRHEWIKSALFSPGLVHEPVHEAPEPTSDEAARAYLVLPPAYGSQPQVC